MIDQPYPMQITRNLSIEVIIVLASCLKKEQKKKGRNIKGVV